MFNFAFCVLEYNFMQHDISKMIFSLTQVTMLNSNYYLDLQMIKISQ
ncbi:hypothetical protein SAMN04487988_10497 [Algoriphagus hitonicola]|uniref:Uncharacterized protein n=1 Tax=Algoriphagus hitonicola TaxID=435880 RepID=A0A1I2S810_9BACT|nr:hypothetical protein SAMN04487988_10497 [Algoriphagus hitonicola]